ncbi:hypothetical protein J3Q64DRAFT_1746593, partial [Phycomyces blakesleeanus]
MLQCETCQQFFHEDCIIGAPGPLLFGDRFLRFRCAVCTQGEEEYERQNMSWMTIVHLVIYNLMRRQGIEATKIKDRDHKFFRWKEDVCAFIEDHWHYLAPDKQRKAYIFYFEFCALIIFTRSFSNIFQSGFEKFHQSG